MWSLVILSVILLYAIEIAWTYYNMNEFDHQHKIIYLVVGNIVLFFFTWMMTNFQKVEIGNDQISNTLHLVNLFLLAPLNSLIILPQIARVINRYKAKGIKKETAQTRIVIYLIIFAIILFFEIGYIRDFQTMLQTMLANKMS